MFYKFLSKLLTKSHREIPLFVVYFNYRKYKQDGLADSCEVKIHPLIAKDEYINQQLKKVINYIRENYNQEEIV